MTKIEQFLSESNSIEDVFDEPSLTQAYKSWKHIIKLKKIGTQDVLSTHRILMINHMGEEAGKWRICQVIVGGREGKPWYAVPAIMEQWVRNVNDVVENGKREDYRFLERVVREQHILFEKIHPMRDGNGRLGRILMNWTRIRVGLPLIVIERKERSEYYKWFK